MKPLFQFLAYVTFCLTLCSCQTDYTSLPTYSGARQLQAVIEVPAGSARHAKYNREANVFESDKNAVIPFLPYPANFGFIPSTEVGPQGEGLSIMVLTGSLEAGTVIEVLPIATLMLEKPEGDLYPVIIAVPARPSERTLEALNYNNLSNSYHAVKLILQQWFVHHNPASRLKFVGWKDEQFAEKEIQRWMKL